MAGSSLVDEMREAIDLAVSQAEAMRKAGILVFSLRGCSFQLADWKPDEPPPSKELTDLAEKPTPTLLDGFEWEPLADED